MSAMPSLLNKGFGGSTLQTAVQTAVLSAVIVSGLYFGRSVLVPLALAVLLSFVLSPLVITLRRFRFPRALAVASVVGAVVGLAVVLGMSMARQVNELAGDLPRYESTLRDKLKALRLGFAQNGVVDRATATLSGLTKELEQQPVQGARTVARGTAGPELAKPVPVEIHQPPERPLDTYQRIMAALLAPLTITGLVLILIVFILMQREDIRDRVIRLAGAGDIELTTAALNDAAYRLSRLFLAQMAINVGFGFLIAAGLWIIGVPSPLLWGMIATLMRFIPYVGAFLAAVFPVLLAAAVDPGWSLVIWTLALYAVLEPLVGHFVEPFVYGQTTGLSPLAIVVSAILWTALWGPIGLLLATPLTLCLVVLGRHVEGLGFLDVILGDQPPLSPAEAFYQRMLAGSAAEASDQAQQVAKSSGLVDFYDNVAVPGLRLAMIDAERGALDEERMATVYEGVEVLVDDLEDAPLYVAVPQADDSKGDRVKLIVADAPAGSLSKGSIRADFIGDKPAVLCLAAHSPIDAAAAEVLAHLLQRHGINARAASISKFSELSSLDLDGIRMVWISSMSATVGSASIRYLIRRLKRLGTDLQFYGGFWGQKPVIVFADQTVIAGQVATLRDAVSRTIQDATSRQDCSTETASPL
jgi:predicted PurR-regulated permease PerM